MTAPNQTQQQQDSKSGDSRRRDSNERDSSGLAWLAAWLVLHHQAEQRAIAANVVTRLAPLWKILDFHDLRNTQTPWIEAVLPVVRDAYVESQWAAQRFVVDYRHAHLPSAPELPAITGQSAVNGEGALPELVDRPAVRGIETVLPDMAPLASAREVAREPRAVLPRVVQDTPFEAVRATVSLLGTGPGEVKKQMPSPPEPAMNAGRVLSSKVAIRVAIDGGRKVVRRAVDLDHEAVGWARVLNVDPCYFCAMLASRGSVYKHTSFTHSNDLFEGEGVAKVHDACRCGMRPVYSQSDKRDPTSEALWRLWKEHAQGLPAKEAIRAFRRNYEVPDFPEAPQIDMHSFLVQRNRLLKDGFGHDSSQVRWIDQQIDRFGAMLGTTGVVTPSARTATRAAAPRKSAESTTEVAKRHLPALEKLVESLISRGFSEDSPQVRWNRKQIARFKALLK